MLGDETGRTGRSPTEVVTDLLIAIGDGRVADVLALVDPAVVWLPSIRPGRTVYEGHAGVTQFVADLHAAYGRFQIVVESVTAEDSTDADGGEARVTAGIGGVRETEGGQVALPLLTAMFTLRGGLVTTMESSTEG